MATDRVLKEEFGDDSGVEYAEGDSGSGEHALSPLKQVNSGGVSTTQMRKIMGANRHW